MTDEICVESTLSESISERLYTMGLKLTKNNARYKCVVDLFRYMDSIERTSKNYTPLAQLHVKIGDLLDLEPIDLERNKKENPKIAGVEPLRIQRRATGWPSC